MLVLIAGTSMGIARKLIESRKLTRTTEIVRKLAGDLIILVGTYFAYTAIK